MLRIIILNIDKILLSTNLINSFIKYTILIIYF